MSDAKHPVLHIPHGTAQIMSFAERLPPASVKVREFHGFSEAAELLLICRVLLERLAPFEGDIDATLGDG